LIKQLEELGEQLKIRWDFILIVVVRVFEAWNRLRKVTNWFSALMNKIYVSISDYLRKGGWKS
jgi:hypothetical protein